MLRKKTNKKKETNKKPVFVRQDLLQEEIAEY